MVHSFRVALRVVQLGNSKLFLSLHVGEGRLAIKHETNFRYDLLPLCQVTSKDISMKQPDEGGTILILGLSSEASLDQVEPMLNLKGHCHLAVECGTKMDSCSWSLK